MSVYLDHNSTAPLREEVLERWLEVVREAAGNPSSQHAAGRRARDIVDDARQRIAAVLGVHEDEIFFTSGATEANNLALFGVAEARARPGRLVTTASEHSSVLGAARELEARGFGLSVAPVDRLGLPDPAAVAALASQTGVVLVSVSAANNETGALPDVPAIARGIAALPERPLLHVDAVQALGKIHVDLRSWGVDLASFSVHKLGGPPGVGIFWRKLGVPLKPRFFGGGQELDLRPGTENVPGIAAAAVAVELAAREQPAFAARTARLARDLWRELAATMPELSLVGPPLGSERRLPNTLCVLVPGTDGKVLVTRLDLAGLSVSSGSACASGSIEPSHVLLAMGLSRDEARAGLRISLGRNTTPADCKRARAILHDELRASRAT